ncbi:MAG: NAD(P)-dependent oxidoreductase, partial [Protaetiibacter sp.]
LANARGTTEAPTAELAVALLLAATRELPAFARFQARAEWGNRETRSVLGSRVAVLGQGGVGARVAELLEGFGADVVRFARTARCGSSGHDIESMDAIGRVAPELDALVCCLPATPQTAGLVDAALLAELKAGAIVVNVGRGIVVDTAALTAEVLAGRLFAALDVTEPEPLPRDHPLWAHPNVVLTPHVGGNTASALRELAALVREQVRRLRAGEPIINSIARGAATEGADT